MARSLQLLRLLQLPIQRREWWNGGTKGGKRSKQDEAGSSKNGVEKCDSKGQNTDDAKPPEPIKDYIHDDSTGGVFNAVSLRNSLLRAKTSVGCPLRCSFCATGKGGFSRNLPRHEIIEQVKRKIDLVYGGGSVGLMGLISRRVYEGGFHVLGIISKALMPIEISGETVGDVRVVADMHERKAAMAQEAEAFIALPGGYGTMEELLEMITWSQAHSLVSTR